MQRISEFVMSWHKQYMSNTTPPSKAQEVTEEEGKQVPEKQGVLCETTCPRNGEGSIPMNFQ